jgi:hypothetical protein
MRREKNRSSCRLYVMKCCTEPQPGNNRKKSEKDSKKQKQKNKKKKQKESRTVNPPGA